MYVVLTGKMNSNTILIKRTVQEYLQLFLKWNFFTGAENIEENTKTISEYFPGWTGCIL